MLIVDIILVLGFLSVIIYLGDIGSSIKTISRALNDFDNKLKITERLIYDKQVNLIDNIYHKLDDIREEIRLLNKSMFTQLTKMNDIKTELDCQDDLTNQDDLTDSQFEKATFGSILNEQLYEIRTQLEVINKTLQTIQDKIDS